MNTKFAQEVDAGLSAENKSLPSKYFYDAVGDALFVSIMHSDEYYLTRSELDIFTNQKKKMIQQFNISADTPFELVELGAGDGLKTKQLLEELLDQGFDFTYLPIDISQSALDNLESSLKKELPKLNVNTVQGEYFTALGKIKSKAIQRVVLFLGSNLGNMSDAIAQQFLTNLDEALNPGNNLLLGLDLIKAESIVLPAYNDAAGFTRDFNLNLLKRINRELGGNFDLEQWNHTPTYSESDGIARSSITSLIEQTVTISAIDKTFEFSAGEAISTEISRKYNDEILATLLRGLNLKINHKLHDSKGYFCDYILEKQG